MNKVNETYKNLLDKWDNVSIVRVSKVDFELSDGSVLPIIPPLEEEMSIEEFEKSFKETLETLKSC
jgi:hypothetical protein